MLTRNARAAIAIILLYAILGGQAKAIKDLGSNPSVKPHKFTVVAYYNKGGCVKCHLLQRALEQTAQVLNGLVKIRTATDPAAVKEVNAEDTPVIRAYYGVQNASATFKGALTTRGLAEWVSSQVQESLKLRLKKLEQPSSSSSASSSKKGDNLVELDSSNFDTVVMHDKDHAWLIEIYAPWCGHCKAFASTWRQICKELDGRVKCGMVNGDANSEIMRRFNARGFPTVFALPAGAKFPGSMKSYSGNRDKQDVLSFALRWYTPEIKVDQLLDSDMFYESCAEGVCVLAFLPHLLDSKAAGRNEYLAILKQAAKEHGLMGAKTKLFWLQGGDSFELEEKLNLQFGYPAYIAINLDKGRYSIHRGKSSKDSLKSFFTSLMTGRLLEPLPKQALPFKKMKPWDGKDAVPPSDEL